MVCRKSGFINVLLNLINKTTYYCTFFFFRFMKINYSISLACAIYL